MTALGGQHAFTTGVVARSSLVLADGGRGLKRSAEEDGHAVGDAALDAARVVGLCGQLRAGDSPLLGGGVGVGGGDKGVVVAGAVHLGAEEAGANLEALDGGDGHDGVAEQGLELVKAGLAQARRGVADDAGDGAAGAVVCVAEGRDALLHALARLLVRAADGEEAVDLVAGEGVGEAEKGRVGAHGVGVAKQLDVAHGRDKGDNLDAVGLAQPLFGHGAGGDAGNRLAGGAAAAARGGLGAVLFQVGPVGVRRARVEVNRLVAVVLGPLVLVGHGEQDGRAEGAAKLGARVNRHLVLFVARRRDRRLAGAAAVELRLDVALGQGEVRRAVFDDARDGFAVGLARAGVRKLVMGKESSIGWDMDVRGHAEVIAERRHCVTQKMGVLQRGRWVGVGWREEEVGGYEVAQAEVEKVTRMADFGWCFFLSTRLGTI